MVREAEPSDEDELARRLEQLRAVIAVGHVFAMDDEVSGRTDAGKRNRPVVLVRVPPLAPRAAVALQQRVQVSTRRSWKPVWGPPPDSPQAEQRLLERNGWIFSPAKSVAAFNKDGIFEVRRSYPVKVSDLVRCRPLGWLLPASRARKVMAQYGTQLPERYPPDGR